MIFCEYASPMPGSASNSSLVAVLMSSLPAAFAFSDCLEAADVCALLLEPFPFAWADISEGAANINSAISVIASVLTFSPRGTVREDAASAFQSCTPSRAAHSCRAVTNLVYRMASFLITPRRNNHEIFSGRVGDGDRSGSFIRATQRRPDPATASRKRRPTYRQCQGTTGQSAGICRRSARTRS